MVLLLLFIGALCAQSKCMHFDRGVMGLRGGSKETSDLSGSTKEGLPASAIEVITLGDNRGLLIRKKGTSNDEFFIATVERSLSGNYTLQLVSSSVSSGKKGGILKDAVESLKDRKEFNVLECDGLFGVYQLPSGYYLALITKSSKVGSDSAFPTMDSDVREVDGLSLVHIPCRTQNRAPNGNSVGSYANAEQVGKEVKVATEMLLNTVGRHSFYFVSSASGASLGYDITRNMQAQAEIVEIKDLGKKRAGSGKPAKISWDQCDERFFWNLHAVSSLAEAGLDSFIIPVTNAWTSSCELPMEEMVDGSTLKLGLISRRSRHRQGQRYIKRGSDEAGDVANFVETEQILSLPQRSDSLAKKSRVASEAVDETAYLSLVQVRGSIPIYWTQPETWRLKPEIVPVRNLLLHARALKTHLVDLFLNYFSGASASGARGEEEVEEPALFFVNLIDKSGMQGRLGKWLLAAFERVQRGGVDCISRAPASGSATSSAAQDQASRDSNARAQLLSHFDELPLRVERETGLRERRYVTVKDYSCAVRAIDMAAVDGMAPPAPDDKRSKRTAAALTTRFVWFDYHKKCSKGAVHNLAQLFKPLQSAVSLSSGSRGGNRSDGGGSYAVLTADRRLLSPQRKLVRTNCVDCLDRTNVVQTAVARWVLRAQLASIGLPLQRQRRAREREEEEEDDVPMSLPRKSMENSFRQLWGNNGDAMSLLYAGTPALKRDVTRTGKRTNQGVFDDGMNSAMRYYINNYKDEQTQKALDFTLGHRAPSTAPAPTSSAKSRGRIILDRGDKESVRRTLQGRRGHARAPQAPAQSLSSNKVKDRGVAKAGEEKKEGPRGGAGGESVGVTPSKAQGQGEGPPAPSSSTSPGPIATPVQQNIRREEEEGRRREKLAEVERLLNSLATEITKVTHGSTSISSSSNSTNRTAIADGGVVNVDGKAAILWLETYLNSTVQELSVKVSTPYPVPSGKDTEVAETEETGKREDGKSSEGSAAGIVKPMKANRTRRTEKKKGKREVKLKVTKASAGLKKAPKKPMAKVVLPNFIKRPVVPEPKQQSGALEVVLRAWQRIHPITKMAILLNLFVFLLLAMGLPTPPINPSKARQDNE